MQLLLIKLLLTPLSMLAVSWAARRWGPGIGGLLAGLPLTSGPISIDGSFDHSFCIRSRFAVERLTFANPGSSVASLRLCPSLI